MGKADQVKESIMETTIELLKKSGGNINTITIRDIATLSGVGTGLINYHFGTKDHLIELCVQRIISNVISAFRPRIDRDMTAEEKLKETAKQVVDFLMANPEISKISILGDMVAPKLTDNTMKTVSGFMATVSSGKNGRSENIKLLTYCFTLILQGVFLRKDSTGDSVGFDFNRKKDRDTFIDFIIERLYEGELS